MKLLFLINNHSGKKDSKKNIVDAIEVFCKKGIKVISYVTQKKNDAYEYIMANSYKYDLLAVAGGDGTLNEVSNALMRKKYKPKLIYFPTGTMNDFGSNFDLGNNYKSIADKAMNFNCKEFDVGKINNSYFNYVSAFGNMCDVPFTTDRGAKENLGVVAYFLQGIKQLDKITPIETTYIIDSKQYQSTLLFGFIYSGNRVSGMKLGEKEEMGINDGLFDVLLVDYIPSLFNAPSIAQVLINQGDHIHHYKTDNISFIFKKIIPWTIDGEEFKANKKVDINLYHSALSLLA